MTRPNSHAHAQSRAKDRYGVAILPEEFERMAVEIEQGRATFVRKAMGERGIYLVHCPKANRYIPVVYDPHAGGSRIITVLPEESWQFGTIWRRPKGPKFREIDPEDVADEPAPEVDTEVLEALATHEPDNILAAALKEALEEAGWPPALAQNSPSRS